MKTIISNFNAKVIVKIANLTGDNNHVAALVAGAGMLKLTKLMKKFKLIQQLQELEGELPNDLSKYRYTLYKSLMEQAKQNLKPEEYEQFHSAY